MFLAEVEYRSPILRGLCAVNVGAGDIAHEHCQCPDMSSRICKTMCDSDKNCKGYVKSGLNCLVATISTCQHGCVKYAKGIIGDLVIDSTSGGNRYEGCFIKLSGNP